MDDCPFCDYSGPSEIITESAGVFVIEPINPVTPGHVLVIPRHHVEDWIGTGSLADASAILSTLLLAQDYAHEADYGDCNLITSRGPTATQTIRHLHLHIVPRREGDGLALPWTDG